jgi:hypothetical protein
MKEPSRGTFPRRYNDLASAAELPQARSRPEAFDCSREIAFRLTVEPSDCDQRGCEAASVGGLLYFACQWLALPTSTTPCWSALR